MEKTLSHDNSTIGQNSRTGTISNKTKCKIIYIIVDNV